MKIGLRGGWWTLGVLLLFGGCEGPEGAVSAEPPFPGSATSLDDLGESAIEALVRGDTASLGALRLTEWEHNEMVWPELPASRPEVNFPVDLAWENIQLRNDRDLRRALPWFEGRDLRYRDVECRGEEQEFASFVVLTDCYIVFDAQVEGRLEAQLFKDVLVRNGGYKVFRYYDEAPRAHRGV
jgi:hypothetical protein